MIIFIAVIIFILICIIFFFYKSKPKIENFEKEDDSEHVPTLHSKCDINQHCGGDLICNKNCKRCKKQLGGDCSMDIDCDEGLKCHDWKCVSKIKKHVKWND